MSISGAVRKPESSPRAPGCTQEKKFVSFCLRVGPLTAYLFVPMAKALTKSQIAASIAETAGITKKQSAEIFETIAQLAYKNAKNSFTLPGLGKPAKRSKSPPRKSSNSASPKPPRTPSCERDNSSDLLEGWAEHDVAVLDAGMIALQVDRAGARLV